MTLGYLAPYCWTFRQNILRQKENGNNVKFAEIDIDMEEKLAQKYMVRAVPCIIIFKDGKEVNRIIGYQNKEYLKKEILKNM